MPRDWDQHYSDPANHKQAPEPLLVEAAELLAPGRALDLACGVGQNALYLASLGWRVTAVDRSAVAIAALRRAADGAAIEAHTADLEVHEFAIEPGAFDLVCDFFYLQRDHVEIDVVARDYRIQAGGVLGDSPLSGERRGALARPRVIHHHPLAVDVAQPLHVEPGDEAGAEHGDVDGFHQGS